MVTWKVERITDEPFPRHTRREEWRIADADGTWTLKFRDPRLRAKEVDVWQAVLLHNKKDVSPDHPELRKLGAEDGFHLPYSYRPWCREKRVIALYRWGGTLILYQIDQRCVIAKRLSEWPWRGLQFAPNGDLLAIIYERSVQFTNAEGADVASIDISHPDLETPGTFWWSDGERFFVVSRKSNRARTEMCVYSARTGAFLDGTDFDPLDIVPYDSNAYSRIGRDGYNLLLKGGTQAVGRLLDVWQNIEFDSEKRLLRAQIARPSGSCQLIGADEFRKNLPKGAWYLCQGVRAEYKCEVKTQTVEVTISA